MDGKWVFAGKIIIYRDYTLFGVLAGVRDESIECVSGGAKGWPEDVSKFLDENYGEKDVDLHSHSWLSLEEIDKAEKLYKEHMKEQGDRFPPQLSNLKKLKELPFVEDVRFVFCFDN